MLILSLVMFYFWDESQVLGRCIKYHWGFQAAAGENKTEDTDRVKKALSVFTVVKVNMQCLVFCIILDIILHIFNSVSQLCVPIVDDRQERNVLYKF